MENNIIVICGFSGAGKDAISNLLKERDNYNFVTSITTRPMREYESEGSPYYFLTMNENFEELIKEDKLIEYRTYNTLFNNEPRTYYYGVEKSEIEDNKKYVVVLDVVGLCEFKKYFKDRVISIYIDVDSDEREKRARLRGSFCEKEWQRRLNDDKRIFSSETFIDNIDFIVDNNTKNIEDCYNKIKNILKGE